MSDLSEFTESGRQLMLAAKAACLAGSDTEIRPAHLLQACAVTQPALLAGTLAAAGLEASPAASLSKALTPRLELPPSPAERRKLSGEAMAVLNAARQLAAEKPEGPQPLIALVHLWAAAWAAEVHSSWLSSRGWTQEQIAAVARAAERQLPPLRASTVLKLSEEHAQFLDSLCQRNISELARQGRLSPAWGMDDTRNELVRNLLRLGSRNVVLTGRPGVGKTKAVEDLACRIAAGEIPELAGCEVFELDLMRLARGTALKGSMEERLARMMQVLREHAERVILFIDEIHMIGSVHVDGEQATLANVLKPFLVVSRVRVIGATTTEEFRLHIGKDQALARRFSEVKVPEPDQAMMLRLLRARAPEYEAHHGVTYTDESLQAIYDLTQRYLPNQSFPAKGVDLLDEVGVHVRMRRRSEAAGSAATEVVARDVADTLARVRGIAVNEPAVDLAAILAERVIGQDEAARTLADAVITSTGRFGSRHRKGPRATVMFLGPPGVGKSYMAEVLSDTLSPGRMTMLTLDMAEFGGPNGGELAKMRLLGAPAGYRGFEQGGMLTNHALQYPTAVILVDEFDKAAPEARHVLLKALNDGWVHDNTNRIVSLESNIFILTANAAQSVWLQRTQTIGFLAPGVVGQPASSVPPPAGDEAIHEALRRENFSAELLSRISHTVLFRALNKDTLVRIAQSKFEETRDAALMQEMAALEFDAHELAMWIVERLGSSPDARRVGMIYDRLVDAPLARWRWQRTGQPSPVVIGLRPVGPTLELSERTDAAARTKVRVLMMERLARAFAGDQTRQQRLMGAGARIVN